MNSTDFAEQFEEHCEQYIDRYGLSSAIYCLAEIARNRGNVMRENGEDRKVANRWTGCGAVLFVAGEQVSAWRPLEIIE